MIQTTTTCTPPALSRSTTCAGTAASVTKMSIDSSGQTAAMAERENLLLSATRIVLLEASMMARLTAASWRSCAITPSSGDAPHGEMMAVSNRTERSDASASGPVIDPSSWRTDPPGVMRLMLDFPNKAPIAWTENGITVSLVPTRTRAISTQVVPLSRATASPFRTSSATAAARSRLVSANSISLMAYGRPSPSIIMLTAPPRVRRKTPARARCSRSRRMVTPEMPSCSDSSATSTFPSLFSRSKMRSCRLVPFMIK